MAGRLLATLCLAAVAGGVWMMRAQDSPHPDCPFFGPQRERFLRKSTGQLSSDLTAQVASMLPPASHERGRPRRESDNRETGSRGADGSSNLIDYFIWQAFQANGVTPANRTSDYEFIRRVTLDLTGRIPTADRVVSFAADPNPNKRANLIESLLASPEWADRWTMFFGDLFKNAQSWPSTGTRIGAPGRDAFNSYIRNALLNGTPYNQVASALIGSEGTNNFTQGELNWMISGRVVGTGIPIQDTWDQQTANMAETFLGISHLNCLLCHNGRGHLDSLSLWGASTTRQQAWGVSAFLAHTNLQDPTDPASGQKLWYVNDGAYNKDYPLNTTTGNRPARQPIGSQKTVTPNYIFTGQGPNNGEGYRQALARLVTSDLQFARATVNYVWAAFFTMGIVDPPDQFDPARLDPNHPPPAPWTLQPSNPELLNALAEDFVANHYDLKHLMRLIANSNTYQLESQYDPNKWNPNWAPLFARKLVRRLWGEEIADSIALSSNVPNSFTYSGNTINWAMQSPEPALEPNPFLQAFLPGDRDLNPRRPDGGIQQALALMNDKMVMQKLVSSGSGATQTLLSKALAQSDDATLVNTLYLNILSRYPAAEEMDSAKSLLGSGNRAQKAQEVMWTLYNKVDFIFNY